MNTLQALLPTLLVLLAVATLVAGCVLFALRRDVRVDAQEHDAAERDGGPILTDDSKGPVDPLVRAYVEGFKQGVRSERRSRIWTASASPVAAPDAISNRN